MMTVKLPPNVPQLLSLQETRGDYQPKERQVSYLTTDGRLLVLSETAATELNLLELQPGETFQVCKRVSGERGDPPHIDVWLTTATEQERAKAETLKARTAEVPEPEKRTRRKKVLEIRPELPAQPSFWDHRGTGTYGPIQQPAIAARKPPERIPFNVAFSEVVQFVCKGLKDAGEQWNDAAKQDAVSTILIAASRDGQLTLWERNND